MIDRSAAPRCDLRVYSDGARVLAVLTGALRMQEAERVKRQLLALLTPDIAQLDVHLGGLQEVDSAGLGLIVGLHMTARKNGCLLRVLSPAPYHLRLFESTRIVGLLTIVLGAEADAARQALERPEFARPLPEPAGP